MKKELDKEENRLTESVQDYLKTIYKLQETDGTVSTTQIAKELGFTGASVTGMLKRLSTMELVDYNSYKGVRLTDLGTKISLEILRHHRLLELYLKQSLGFSLAKVHDEACRLEHYVSDEFIEKIDELLGHPDYSPLGNPIPSKDGTVPVSSALSLALADLNKQYHIQRISDDNQEMVAYFEEMGFLPGLQIKLLSRAPFNGPLNIEYSSKEEIIGYEIARNIFVAV
jgi:DtxR family Mn-dependent transcriptional regulator